MKKIVLIMILIGFGPVALSESINPEELVKNTIRLLQENKPIEAFNLAIGSNELAEAQKTEFDSLKYQFAGHVTQVGAPLDCEPLASRNLIDRYRIEQFLCLSPMQPFILQFDFYKPDKEWRIQGFSFNNSTDDYIEDSIEYEIGEKSKLDY